MCLGLILFLFAGCDPLRVLDRMPKGPVHESKHFEVYVHFDSPEVARRLGDVVESSFRHATQLFGVPIDPDERMGVHLYRTVADYETVEAALTGGRFRRNLAFFHYKSRTAHVALQPFVSAELIAAVGVPTQTMRMIAHEASHLTVGPAQQSWPGWMREGAACWIDQQVMEELGYSPGAESGSWVATKINRVKKLHAATELPTAAKIVRTKKLDLPFNERYAVWTVFFMFLAERHAEPLARFLDQTRNTTSTRKLAATFEREFAEPGLRGLDKEFKAYVDQLAPTWLEEGRSIGMGRDGWVHVPFSLATVWSQRTPSKLPYTISGTFEFLPAKESEVSVLLGERAGSFAAVRFANGRPPRLMSYDVSRSEQDRWEAVADGTLAVADGGERRFEITIRSGSVAVQLDGEPALSAEFTPPAESGRWGLQVPSGSAALWRSIQLAR